MLAIRWLPRGGADATAGERDVRVTVIRGHAAREKTVHVEGIDDERARAALLGARRRPSRGPRRR